jgi:hypothetical protein
MTQIRDLTSTTAVASGDLIPIASAANGVDMKMSVNQLITYFASNFASPTFTVQTAIPTNGSTTTVTSTTTSTWLLLRPAAAIATATITLPAAASCFDGQNFLVASSQDINALTVTSSGATMQGVPAGMRAGEAFAMKYNTASLTWIAVGDATSFFSTATVTTALVDANGNEQIKFATTPSAVNELTFTNAAAGGTVVVTASGGDTNIPLGIVTKGTGKLTLAGGIGASVEIGTGFGTINLLDNMAAIAITASSTVQALTIRHTASSTVAAIPSAVTAGAGARRFITDGAAVATVGTTLTGGGALFLPVYSDGTVWRYG